MPIIVNVDVMLAKRKMSSNELASKIAIEKMQTEETELMQSLALYYRIFILHMTPEQLGLAAPEEPDGTE